MEKKKYQNRDWLFDQYITQKKSTTEIGKELNCSSSAIWDWLDKFNIPRRSLSEALKICWNKPEFIEKMSGKNSSKWKGGKRISGGYYKIKNPNHLRADDKGYVFEHVLIAEEMIGRSLKWYGNNHKDSEVVHHIDNNRINNNPKNLYICRNKGEHIKIHTSTFDLVCSFMMDNIIGFDKEKGEYYRKDRP